MRDTRCDAANLKMVLENESDSFDYFVEAISREGHIQNGTPFGGLLQFFNIKFQAQYGLGIEHNGFDDECEALLKTLAYYNGSKPLTLYSELINTLSIFVLTDQPQSRLDTLKEFLIFNGLDNEMIFLLADLDGYSKVKHPYITDYWKPAYFAIKEKSPAKLLKFLDLWYENMSYQPWYNSHLNPERDTYFGYWCLTAAAIAKTHNIISDDILNHEYFPKDLLK